MSPPPISPMVRTALMVSNLERMSAFYSDTLGLSEVYFEAVTQNADMNRLVGILGDEPMRVLILKQPGGPNMGMVGLFEATSNRNKSIPKRTGQLQVGEAALVFYVQDLSRLEQRLQQPNIEIVCPATFLKLSHNSGQQEMTIRDPEGNCINLIERPVDQALKHVAVGQINPVF